MTEMHTSGCRLEKARAAHTSPVDVSFEKIGRKAFWQRLYFTDP